MFNLMGVKAWLIAGALALAAITGSYLLGSSRGDTAGYGRATSEHAAAEIAKTQEHASKLAAVETEKRALQDRVNEAEIQRQMASQEQILKLYPDPKDTSTPVYLPPAMRKVLGGLAK